MKKGIIVCALLALCAQDHAAGRHPFSTTGLVFANGGPLSLAELSSSYASSSLFTFKGSFPAPSPFAYAGGALSTSGSTLYMEGYNGSVRDIGSMVIPTLSGTPDYTGGNGTISTYTAPVLPTAGLWGSSSDTYAITGSKVFGSNLVLTGGITYDASCSATLGWAVQTPASSIGSSWGSINTVSEVPSALWPAGVTSVESSRFLAGTLHAVPPIWQPYFGTAYATGGPTFSIASCFVSQGPSFVEFAPSNVTNAGATVPVTVALGYSTSPSSQSLANRAYSGPYPLTTTTGYYPATLSSAPSSGATSVSISLPTGTVTMTANVSSYSVAATSVTGTLSDSAIVYSVTDSAGVLPANTLIDPSYDYPPGTSLSTGTYRLWLPANSTASSDTLTLTPDGYNMPAQEAWTMFFSDGESRVGTISGSTFTFSPALACSPSCAPAVTVAPMGDAWLTDYDGPEGDGFFVPNTRTFMALSIHKDGPDFGRSANACDPTAAASQQYETPLSPDTTPYEEMLVYLYDAQQLYNGAQGTQPVYQASPYAELSFPDQANLKDSNGCFSNIGNYGSGWARFDVSTDILYISLLNGSGSTPIVYEYAMTPP